MIAEKTTSFISVWNQSLSSRLTICVVQEVCINRMNHKYYVPNLPVIWCSMGINKLFYYKKWWNKLFLQQNKIDSSIFNSETHFGTAIFGIHHYLSFTLQSWCRCIKLVVGIHGGKSIKVFTLNCDLDWLVQMPYVPQMLDLVTDQFICLFLPETKHPAFLLNIHPFKW